MPADGRKVVKEEPQRYMTGGIEEWVESKLQEEEKVSQIQTQLTASAPKRT